MIFLNFSGKALSHTIKKSHITKFTFFKYKLYFFFFFFLGGEAITVVIEIYT